MQDPTASTAGEYSLVSDTSEYCWLRFGNGHITLVETMPSDASTKFIPVPTTLELHTEKIENIVLTTEIISLYIPGAQEPLQTYSKFSKVAIYDLTGCLHEYTVLTSFTHLIYEDTPIR